MSILPRVLALLPLVALLFIPCYAQTTTPVPSFDASWEGKKEPMEWGNIWVGKVKTTLGDPIYKVSYEYDFGSSKTVYIKGVGQVPGKGKLTYLSHNSSVEFRESIAGPILAVAKTESLIPIINGTVDLPLPSHFPQPPLGRDTRWDSKQSFQEIATETTTNKRFQAYAYEQDGVAYLTTTYCFIEGLPKNLIGQIALRLSYPYRKDGGTTWYRVEVATRERRLKEADWIMPARSLEMQMASNMFLDQFLKEIDASVKRSK